MAILAATDSAASSAGTLLPYAWRAISTASLDEGWAPGFWRLARLPGPHRDRRVEAGGAAGREPGGREGDEDQSHGGQQVGARPAGVEADELAGQRAESEEGEELASPPGGAGEVEDGLRRVVGESVDPHVGGDPHHGPGLALLVEGESPTDDLGWGELGEEPTGEGSPGQHGVGPVFPLPFAQVAAGEEGLAEDLEEARGRLRDPDEARLLRRVPSLGVESSDAPRRSASVS